MAPAYVIEVLALPLEDGRERRQGLRALRSVLWAEGGAALPFPAHLNLSWFVPETTQGKSTVPRERVTSVRPGVASVYGYTSTL